MRYLYKKRYILVKLTQCPKTLQQPTYANYPTTLNFFPELESSSDLNMPFMNFVETAVYVLY